VREERQNKGKRVFDRRQVKASLSTGFIFSLQIRASRVLKDFWPCVCVSQLKIERKNPRKTMRRLGRGRKHELRYRDGSCASVVA
jgi:hypothetical protein